MEKILSKVSSFVIWLVFHLTVFLVVWYPLELLTTSANISLYEIKWNRLVDHDFYCICDQQSKQIFLFLQLISCFFNMFSFSPNYFLMTTHFLSCHFTTNRKHKYWNNTVRSNSTILKKDSINDRIHITWRIRSNGFQLGCDETHM